jgi:Phage integrase family
MVTSGLVPRNQQLDLGQYDRDPALTVEEIRTFDTWAASPLFKLGEYRLPRLFRPLSDVLSPDDLDLQCRLRTIRFVLEEVGRRRRAYWGWGDVDWLDLLRSPAATSNKVTKPHLLAIAYVLGDFRRMHDLRCFSLPLTARAVFGAALFDSECQRLLEVLRRVGYGEACMPSFMPATFAAVALENGSPLLETLNEAVLERVAGRYRATIRTRVTRVSHGLTLLGILSKPLNRRPPASWRGRSTEGVHPEWARWCQRWRDTSTFRSQARGTHYSYMLRTGLWLAKKHPEVTSPAHWSVETCADFLAAVDRLTVGEWSLASTNQERFPNRGKPLDADTKSGMFQAIRRFLTDCQLWEWTTLRCNPRYHLATPTSVKRHLGVNPRTIDDATWLKLVWASLNLESSDLPRARFRYPFEAMQAIAVIWTHAGLRGNEIVRLRLGCARAQDDAIVDDAGASIAPGTLCYLDVPAGKTFTSFSKPVAAAVKLYVDAWAAVRPEQATAVDEVTGERASFLFQYRGQPMSNDVLNRTVIPILCTKAGVPRHDSRGPITSHRGRASAVTALANAPQGMTLLELMTWCGHRNPQSTMYYVRVKPTRLAGAFARADRMAHMIEVVVDQEAIAGGSAARDAAPWKYYDLGDSYCSNAFWSTCPHRMACAGCFFNVPKSSARGQALEAQRSAARLLEEVWLSPDERAAVEGDVTALQGMLAKLQDVPALDGRTPGQIMSGEAADLPP